MLLKEAYTLFSKLSLPIAQVFRAKAILCQREKRYTEASEFIDNAAACVPHDTKIKKLQNDISSLLKNSRP